MRKLPPIVGQDEFFIEDSHVYVRIKPTNHEQKCAYCKEYFSKGDAQIAVDKLTGNYSYIKYCYYHPNCFICMLTRLFRHASIKAELDCNKCKHRFSCFTGG